MDVSVWWVVVASIAGVWIGFLLFALMAIAREQPVPERVPDHGATDTPY